MTAKTAIAIDMISMFLPHLIFIMNDIHSLIFYHKKVIFTNLK